MSIPSKFKDVTKDHIEQAATMYKAEKFPPAKKFEVEINGSRFPIKAIGVLASQLAGKPLTEEEFITDEFQKCLRHYNLPIVPLVGTLTSTVISQIHQQNRKTWRCATSGKWQDFKKNSAVTMDWLNPKIDYRQAGALEGSGSRPKKKWVNELSKGDIIVIMDKYNYFGICIALNNYEFNTNDIDFSDGSVRPAIPVRYIHALDKPIPHNFSIAQPNPDTFFNLNGHGFNEIKTFVFIETKFPEVLSLLSKEVVKKDVLKDVKNETNRMSKNTILYGPPGTGKTYHTVNKAVTIINPELALNATNRETLHAEFDSLIENGQVQFITFHQSLSYEDFIEGIKPHFDEAQKVMKYPVTGGTFKNICFEALKSMYYANVEAGEEISIDALYDEFINQTQTTYKDGDYPFKTKDNSELRPDQEELGNGRLVVYYRYSNNSTKDAEGKTPFPIKKEKIKAMYEANITENESNLKVSLKPIISYHLSPYYAVYKSFLKFVKNKVGYTRNVSSLDDEVLNNDYDSFLQKILLLKRKKEELNPGKPFVLIIDEINRGNVSQIFGELITLLEPDKRLGSKEVITLKLTYSKSDFSVPGNLYIIATMNTADRSVEALDTALRRRFEFEEIAPQPQLLNSFQRLKDFWIKYKHTYEDDKKWMDAEKAFTELHGMQFLDKEAYEALKPSGINVAEFVAKIKPEDFKSAVAFDGVDLEQLLNIINRRLEVLLTSDHKIGHAWLMNVFSISDLKAVFQNSILPLLKEYFYGDYGKIGLVIGKGFFEQTDTQEDDDLFAEFDYEDSGLVEKPVYRFRNVTKMETKEFREALRLLIRKPKKES